MNNVVVRTKFDFKTMKYLNLYLMKYKRKFMIVNLILVLFSFGGAGYLFFENKKNFFWAIFLVMGLYIIYQMCTIERRLDRQIEKFFMNRSVFEHVIEISNEKIIITVSGNPEPIEYDWAFVNEIHEIPQYYFLFVNGNGPIILDKSDEAFVEGTKEDLENILKEKAATKPYKKVEKEIAKRPITFVHQNVEIVEEKKEDELLEEINNPENFEESSEAADSSNNSEE